MGGAVRDFHDAINDNPVVKFLKEMAGHGFKLMLATVGIGLMAGAVGKLARAMLLLSGASTAVAILKTVAGVGGAVFGGIPGLPGGGGKGGGKGGKSGASAAGGKPGGKPPRGKLGGILGAITSIVATGAALGYGMSLLKDYEGGVWEINPPKPPENPIANWIEDRHARKPAAESGSPNHRRRRSDVAYRALRILPASSLSFTHR